MLTVKIVEQLNQVETVFEATQVVKSLYPDRKKDDPIIGEIIVDCAERGSITYTIQNPSLDDRHANPTMIYVMNRHGATVGAYEL